MRIAMPKPEKNTSKPRTAKSFFVELEKIRRAYKQKYRGYRDQIYLSLQSSQRLIVELESNTLARSAFLKRVLSKAKKVEAPISLSTEVVYLAFGAKTRKARQNAWKKAQALDYLRKKDIPVAKTAATLRRLGGIERVAAIARRPRALEAKHTKAEKAHGAPKVKLSAKPNDAEIKVEVWMKLSVRDEIAANPAGSTLELRALRLGQANADLKITKVKRIKKGGQAGEADDSNEEWSDW
jgi:hypothetical protein